MCGSGKKKGTHLLRWKRTNNYMPYEFDSLQYDVSVVRNTPSQLLVYAECEAQAFNAQMAQPRDKAG